MSSNDSTILLACRLCRRSLHADGGCFTCRDWKKNITILEGGEAQGREEAVDLGTLAQDTLATLRGTLRAIRSDLVGSKYRDGSANRQLLQLTRAIASMVDTTRKVRKEGAEAIRTMPFTEKLEIFRSWFSELTAVHRAHVLAELMKASEELNQPLGPAILES